MNHPSSTECKDPRWWILGLTIAYTIFASIFISSTFKLYATTFVATYFCIALAADAPEPSNYFKVVSLTFQGVLPAAFIGLSMYQFCVKRTLHKLSGTAEFTIIWLGGLWIGALDNLTFDRLPIQRLIPHDIAAEPGGILAFSIIIVALIAITIGQIWAFRLEGRLPQYLCLYLCIAFGILVLAFVPYMYLRIHHNIVALILLPGTAIQTRPSLLYQGLLIGLFINGIARWGFASILQVPEELFYVDMNRPIPHILTPQITDNNITFSWDNVSTGYDSVSIFVDDVERFRGYEDHDPHYFSWVRDEPAPTYFRFGYVQYGSMDDAKIRRYSDPATWHPNGTWEWSDEAN